MALSRNRRIGTPMTAVTTPTGRVALPKWRPVADPASVIARCDNQSPTIRNAPPTSATMNAPHRCQCPRTPSAQQMPYQNAASGRLPHFRIDSSAAS